MFLSVGFPGPRLVMRTCGFGRIRLSTGRLGEMRRRCSFAQMLQYPHRRHLRRRPRHAGVHRRSAGIPIQSLLTRCLPSPVWPPPRPRTFYGGSVPTRRYRSAADPALRHTGSTAGGTTPDRFPPSLCSANKHPTRSGPATLRHPLGVGSYQRQDVPMPTHPMMAGRRSNRHPPGVLDQAVGDAAADTTSEPGVVLEVPLATVRTHKPAKAPHQRGTPPARLQVTDPLRSPVPHTTTAEPTVRAPRPLPGRFHLGLETVNRVNEFSPYANTPQVQTNGHNIRHRGLLASAICYFTDSSGASTAFQGLDPTHPTFPRRDPSRCRLRDGSARKLAVKAPCRGIDDLRPIVTQGTSQAGELHLGTPGSSSTG